MVGSCWHGRHGLSGGRHAASMGDRHPPASARQGLFIRRPAVRSMPAAGAVLNVATGGAARRAGAPALSATPRRLWRGGGAQVTPGRPAGNRSSERRTAAAASHSSGDGAPAAQPVNTARRLRPLGDPELVEVLELADDRELHELHNLLHGEQDGCHWCSCLNSGPLGRLLECPTAWLVGWLTPRRITDYHRAARPLEHAARLPLAPRLPSPPPLPALLLPCRAQPVWPAAEDAGGGERRAS